MDMPLVIKLYSHGQWSIESDMIRLGCFDSWKQPFTSVTASQSRHYYD